MRLRLLLTVGLALALIVPSLAGAALPQKRPYKMIWGPATLENGASAFPFYRSLGADVLQMQLLWSRVAATRPADARNPGDAAYTWPAEVTRAVEGAAANDMSVMLLVRSTPPWANGNRKPAQAPDDDGDYADFLRAASRRYPSVRHWMIWGEPQRGDQFEPMPAGKPEGPERYARLLDTAYGALKEERADNLIIGGNTWSGGVVSPDDFVRWMRLPDGRPPRLDFYGHNPFGNRFPDITQDPYAQGFRDINDSDTLADEVAAAYGPVGAAPRLWQSEYTVPSAPSNVFNFSVTPAEQGDYLRAAFGLAAVETRIQGLGWFRLQDNDTLAAGLVDAQGVPKPSYASFRSAYCRGCEDDPVSTPAGAYGACAPGLLANPANPTLCIPGPPDDDDPPDGAPIPGVSAPGPAPAGPQPDRSRLTLRVGPRRDRAAPTRYRSRGRLVPPSTVSGGCRGRVTIAVRRGARRVAKRTVRLRRSCRYGTRMTVRKARLGRRGRLVLRARFGGNRLAPAVGSRRVAVRYRR